MSLFLNRWRNPKLNQALGAGSEQFPLKELAKVSTLSEGELFARGKRMDFHDVKEGYHKRGTSITLNDLIKASDKVIAYETYQRLS